MRIAMVSGGSEPIPPVKGGAIDSYAYNISTCLSAQGDFIFLFANQKSSLKDSENLKVKKINYPGTNNYYFDYTIFNFHTLLELLKIRKETDIIHTNLSTTTLFIFPFFKNIIFTSHSSGWWRPYTQHRKQVMAVRKAKGVIAISHFIEEQMKKYRKDKENVFYVPNGVDINFFRPKRHRFEKILLTVGSVSFRKGLIYLFKALRDIIKSDNEVKLLHIGEIPQKGTREWEYYLSLLNFVKKNGLQRNVTFLGRVGIKELLHYYQTSDIFILPSLAEGCPFAILEAMACGIPIISTKISGVTDLVVDGKTGILVPPKDVNGLKSAIEQLLSSESDIRKMGKLARLHTEKNFCWEVVAKKVRDVYEKCLT